MKSFQLILFNTQFQQFADPTGTFNSTFSPVPHPPDVLFCLMLLKLYGEHSLAYLDSLAPWLLHSFGKRQPWSIVILHLLSPVRLRDAGKSHNHITIVTNFTL